MDWRVRMVSAVSHAYVIGFGLIDALLQGPLLDTNGGAVVSVDVIRLLRSAQLPVKLTDQYLADRKSLRGSVDG